jgi:hypothetical protein
MGLKMAILENRQFCIFYFDNLHDWRNWLDLWYN